MVRPREHAGARGQSGQRRREVLEDEIEGNVHCEGVSHLEADVGVEDGTIVEKAGAGDVVKGGGGDDNSPEWVERVRREGGDDKSWAVTGMEEYERKRRTAARCTLACRRTKLRKSRMVFRKRRGLDSALWKERLEWHDYLSSLSYLK